ncbi:MAG: autotransporter-associated beta strand repeat-containing protein, partial [bacterium]
GPAGGVVTVIGEQSIGGLTVLTDGSVLRGGALAVGYYSFPTTIEVGANVTATIESNLVSYLDGVGITKTGAGTLNLWGNNTYAGGTLLQQGTIGVGHNNALGTGALTMEANTTLRALIGNLTLGNAVTLNGGATIDTQSFALTLSGIVSGVGALTKTGTGDLILTGDNSYTGDTTVNAGTLQIAGAGRLGEGNYAGGIALNGGVFRYSSSADQTLSGVISGSGSVTKESTDSALTLTGNNTYTGGTLLQQGTLGVGHNNALGTGALAMSAGTTLRAVIDNLNLANAITLNGAGTVDTQAFAMTLGGIVSGTGDLTKTGTGTLTLSGTNSYTGDTTV